MSGAFILPSGGKTGGVEFSGRTDGMGGDLVGKHRRNGGFFHRGTRNPGGAHHTHHPHPHTHPTPI